MHLSPITLRVPVRYCHFWLDSLPPPHFWFRLSWPFTASPRAQLTTPTLTLFAPSSTSPMKTLQLKWDRLVFSYFRFLCESSFPSYSMVASSFRSPVPFALVARFSFQSWPSVSFTLKTRSPPLFGLLLFRASARAFSKPVALRSAKVLLRLYGFLLVMSSRVYSCRSCQNGFLKFGSRDGPLAFRLCTLFTP